MIASCTSFTLHLKKLVISVKEAEDGAKSSAVLSESWVLLHDVPPLMHSSAALMAFADLIGLPISVDASSLARPGPVRMLMKCLDTSHVRGHIQIFPGDAAFRIFVRLEGLPPFSVDAPPLPLLRLRMMAMETVAVRMTRATPGLLSRSTNAMCLGPICRSCSRIALLIAGAEVVQWRLGTLFWMLRSMGPV